MRTLTLVAVCLLASACSTIKNMSTAEQIKPWQRDVLAQEDMQIPQDDMFSYSDEHIYFSKEASTGGNSVGGGGCGCN